MEGVGLGGERLSCGFGLRDVCLEGFGQGTGYGAEEGVFFWVWRDRWCWAGRCEGGQFDFERGGEKVWSFGFRCWCWHWLCIWRWLLEVVLVRLGCLQRCRLVCCLGLLILGIVARGLRWHRRGNPLLVSRRSRR